MGIGTAVCALAASGTALAGETDQELTLDFPEEKIIRNEDGRIIAVDITDAPVETEYRNVDLTGLMEMEQFQEYESFGLTCDEKEGKLYFAGMEVQMLEDPYEESVTLQYIPEKWYEASEEQQVYLTAVRNADYELQYFEFIRLPESDWMGMDEEAPPGGRVSLMRMILRKFSRKTIWAEKDSPGERT